MTWRALGGGAEHRRFNDLISSGGGSNGDNGSTWLWWHGGSSSSKMAGPAKRQQREGAGAAKQKVSNVQGCMWRHFSYDISPFTSSAFNQQQLFVLPIGLIAYCILAYYLVQPLPIALQYIAVYCTAFYIVYCIAYYIVNCILNSRGIVFCESYFGSSLTAYWHLVSCQLGNFNFWHICSDTLEAFLIL